MGTKLCQIVAVEPKIKTKTQDGVTKIYHICQKTDLFTGMSRTYSPKTDGDETFPPEYKKVQQNIEDLLKDVQSSYKELLDLTATKDFSNCLARADVVVGDFTVVKDAPVTYLLFLEKKLQDMHNVISKLPTLDPTENWRFDSNLSCYVSDSKETHKTKKIKKVLQLAKATDKHPEQSTVFDEDVVVGYWKIVQFSGALPSDRVKQLLNRVEALQRAVKFAREEANSREVDQIKVADKLLGYLFAP